MSKQLVQTVYIPDKDRVHISEFDVITHPAYRLQGQKGIFFTQEEYNKHIKEIIEQTLETAAEKADTTWRSVSRGTEEVVDKDSITNTFEETYLKYKI